jgi:hypothetical protein
MQEQQTEANIEKVSRSFYPPSLAWVHFVDTQWLLSVKVNPLSWPAERCVSGLRYLTTAYRRNPSLTALSASVYAIPHFRITTVCSRWLLPIEGSFFNEYCSAEGRKPSAIHDRRVSGYLQARHERKHNKVLGLDCWCVWCEIKSAFALKPERLKIRLIRMGRIHHPRIVNVPGDLDLRPSIVIVPPLDRCRGNTRPLDLGDCCHPCTVQGKPIVCARHCIECRHNEHDRAQCGKALPHASLIRETQERNRYRQ